VKTATAHQLGIEPANVRAVSRHSREKSAPSNSGIKHLAVLNRDRLSSFFVSSPSNRLDPTGVANRIVLRQAWWS
jgi:hypothetical protein